ncbi:MAG: protein-L-isoaspartate O-methyltransferase family protein [Pseudomonadota bacterium]
MMTLASSFTPAGAGQFESMRHAMVVSQLRTSAVNDPRVVEAMARVPREAFVPAELRAVAYRDRPLPLSGGRRYNSPLATGLLLTQAAVRPDDHVLLIGAAGGYSAAVLAMLAASVVAVEEDESLLAIARGALAGEPKVELARGPLRDGWVEAAPYDVLIVDGAVERLPDALVQQVKTGGRVVTGLVDRGVTRLAAGRRTEGGFGLADFADIECVVLPGFEQPRSFQF